MKQFFLICSSFLFITSSYCQSTLIASGGNAINSSGSISYSMGQIATMTYTSSNGSTSMGVQQPFEISQIVSATDDRFNLDINIYPNPSQEYFWIDIPDQSILNYEIYNSSGLMMIKGQTTSNHNIVNIEDLTTGTYILIMRNVKGDSRSYKIVKH